MDALLYFLVFLLRSLATATAEQIPLCEGGNYTANGTYQSNLRLLLASLSSSNSTYASDTTGDSPHRVYGLVLCRGDVDPTSCPACYQDVSQSITQLCTYSKQAVVWDTNCMLRYSDTRFFSSVDTPQVYVRAVNTASASDTDTFGNMSRALFRGVSSRAAHNSSIMFATGRAAYGGSEIYALAQCTRDLTGDGCGQCLQQEMDEYWECCRASIGARYYGKSCFYQYEVIKFYSPDPDVTITLPLMPPHPPPTTAPPVTTPAMSTEGPPPNKEGKKKIARKIVVTVVPLASALVVIFILYYCWSKRSAKNTPAKAQMEEILSMESLLFDLSILKLATKNFSDSNKLGQGGFGTVYKGTLPNGQEIAVKRLSATSRQGVEELKNELLLVAKLQHKNLVRLRGVCLENEERMLVYEYAPNRSLDTFLFDPIKCRQLNWPKRFEIITGIARGLRYLHEESHLKVIHRDLKPSNVLLDAELNPKISDFGMARLFGIDETHNITSRVVGTFGYMAPEYARRGHFSVKLDVFSYGVMVLEIITGKKSNSFRDHEHDQDLLSYTWEHWTEDAALATVDPSMGEDFSRDEVLRCIQVGLLCIQDAPAKRPLMSTIVIMLHSPNMILPAPLQPVWSMGAKAADTSSSTGQSGFVSSDMSVSKSSVNDVTISELHPR